MPTLSDIRTAINLVLDDSYYGESVIDAMINDALQEVAGGVEMCDGVLSPPLPGLFAVMPMVTVAGSPFTSLPDDYQRGVFLVSDNLGNQISAPTGGEYYDFRLFMQQVESKTLDSAGGLEIVCVKGKQLYYQGVPATAQSLTVHYYRKPAEMVAGSDEPEGIPEHLAKKILKHKVCMEVFGEGIEDGEDSGARGHTYHKSRFYAALKTMFASIEIDLEPIYINATEERIG